MPTDHTLTGMPDFHDSLEYLRLHHDLSREALAREADISASYLHRIIRKRLHPGTKALPGLIGAFDLDAAQQRHLHELLQPSADLAPITELRSRLSDLGIQSHLDSLDNHEVMAALFDPLQTVLHGNRVFHRLMPGIADAGNNIVQWMCTPTARDSYDTWDDDMRYFVRMLRTALGRYRDLPRARALFRTLRTYPEFRRVWDSTPMQLTYGPRTAPFRIRTTGSAIPTSLGIEVDEYDDCPDVIIVHGLYNTTAIAS
ncbi:hypothetical protein ACFVVM_16720 [Nocardia sp. NPDC058176]|uniref:helix-turn-helix domain-containing protein n=1 Tax=Nocardia sp. NPDC058176 TaxID=3346368 RepID=UPI0036DAE409